jgi:hypothetical protein
MTSTLKGLNRCARNGDATGFNSVFSLKFISGDFIKGRWVAKPDSVSFVRLF